MVKYTTSGAPKAASFMTPAERLQLEVELSACMQSLAELDVDMQSIEVQMESCYIALDIISNYKGDDAQIIKLVNCQHAMENLLGVAESKITVSAAKEGLGEALKTAWEKVKALFKKIWDWIKNLFSGTSKKVEEDTRKSNELKDSIKEAAGEELKKLLDEPMPGLLSKKCVDAMYKSSSFISGSNSPIFSYVRNMTRTLNHFNQYLDDSGYVVAEKRKRQPTDEDWMGLRNIATDFGVYHLEPYGMKYTFSGSEEARLTKIDEGFLESCETMKAGGWTSATEYTDKCAVVCNVTRSVFVHMLGNQAQIQRDLDFCGKLADKAKKLALSNKFNLRYSRIMKTLANLASGLQIIALRLKQVNGACYCASLDARVQKLLNRNVQPQYKIDD